MSLRYIQQIRIRGFQSHADITIKFHPGLNAITGQSDSGKSAVLRALAWWAWNVQPSGDWVRKGSALAQVEVTMSDGAVITRERRGSRNSYTIHLPGQPPMVLEAFGTKVPAEVLKAHGMIPVEFVADRPSILNWASQLEAPFFLTETAPMRAKVLGRLAGVHVIDHAIGEIKKDTLAIARKTKDQETEVARLESQLAAYVGLDNEAARVERAEQILDRLGRTEARLDKLRTLGAQIRTVEGSRATVQATLTRLQFVDLIAAMLTQAGDAHQFSVTLRSVRQRLTAHGQEVAATTAALQRLAQVPVMEAALLRAEAAEIRRLQLARVRITHLDTTAAIQSTQAILERTSRAQEAQNAINRLGSTVDTLERLRAAEDELGPLEDAIRMTAHTISWARRVVTAATPLDALGTITGRLDRLRILRTSLTVVQQTQQDVEFTLAKVRRQEEAAGPLEALSTIAGRLDGLRGLKARLTDTASRMEKGSGIIAGLDAQITAAGQAYADALIVAGVCPTCLQTLDPATAARIAATIIEEESHHEHAHAS